MGTSSDYTAEELSISLALLKLRRAIVNHETYEINEQIDTLAKERLLPRLFQQATLKHNSPFSFMEELREAIGNYLGIEFFVTDTNAERWTKIGMTLSTDLLLQKAAAEIKRGGKKNKTGKTKTPTSLCEFRRALVVASIQAQPEFKCLSRQDVFRLLWDKKLNLTTEAQEAKDFIIDWANIQRAPVKRDDKAKDMTKGISRHLEDAHLFLNRFAS